MYQKKFVQSGATVDIAVGSEEALNKLQDGSKPDIILLDIIMPTMDGIELLSAIRQQKLVPEAHIIMLTNESDPERIKQAQALGISGYIIKATKIPSEVVEEAFKIAKINTA